MFGTIINVISVALGSLIGISIGKYFFNDEMKDICIKGIGLVTLILGISMYFGVAESIGAIQFLLGLFSIILGGITGTVLHLEDNLIKFGEWLQEKTSNDENSTFIKGFITASIIFETGPITLLGPINDGLTGNIDLLLIKSGLDGITAIALSSSFGIGVIFSIIPLFIIQGTITLFSVAFSGFISINVVTMINFVGGILILGLGLRILEISDIKMGDLVPSIIWIIILTSFTEFLGFWVV